MHGDPGFHRQRKRLRQHAPQGRITRRQARLAHADAGARADQGQLRQVAVAAPGKVFPRKSLEGRTRIAHEGARLVVADDGMLRQIKQSRRRAMARQVIRVRMQAQFDLAHLARHQLLLARTQHAHGDVRLAAQQILHLVAQHQFNDQTGMAFAQAGQYRRQHFHAHHFAGRDAHDAGHALPLAAGRPFHQGRRVLHGFRMGPQRQGHFRGQQAQLRTREQRRAQRLLQGGDMPADGGLGDGQRTGGAGQGAVPEHGQQRTVVFPGDGGSHT